MANGCPPAFESSPTAADDDCNCVLITSSGFVMQEAIVPATPPDSRFNNCIRDAVMVMEFVATRVDPPRHVDFPPRKIFEVVLLAPPDGMLSGLRHVLFCEANLFMLEHKSTGTRNRVQEEEATETRMRLNNTDIGFAIMIATYANPSCNGNGLQGTLLLLLAVNETMTRS